MLWIQTFNEPYILLALRTALDLVQLSNAYGDNLLNLFHLFCLFQFLILVVDSTDRERLAVTKAELYNMLNHEVRIT